MALCGSFSDDDGDSDDDDDYRYLISVSRKGRIGSKNKSSDLN